MTSHPAAPGAELIDALRGGLVVSCQPVPDGPFDAPDSVVRFALAARNAGAKALRIEGISNIRAVAAACSLPIIGLVKRDLADAPIRITPWIEDVNGIAEAGAGIVAFDATDRMRPVPVKDLIQAAHAQGRLAMADIATIAEAKYAARLGVDIIGTTMSGYTGVEPPPRAPDLLLVTQARDFGRPVIAEGRYNEPRLAAAAIRSGATAVVVGSAITRPEHITRWFVAAMEAETVGAEPVLAIDIGGSKTAIALIQNNRVIARRQVATRPFDGVEAWLQSAADMARDWSGQYGGVAAAVTGLVREGRWFAINPATLPVPAGFDLASRLKALFSGPVMAVNDAQAAAWGEYCFGAGQGRDLLFLTISSGIGGGIVSGGRLLQGSGGLAGHVGQMPVLTSGTEYHRLEQVASGFAIATAACEAGQERDARAVFAAARAGESWAEDIINDAVNHLAVCLPGLQTVIDPQIIVIGGGVGLAPGYLIRLETALSRLPTIFRPSLTPALLGADAGLLGAADLLNHQTMTE